MISRIYANRACPKTVSPWKDEFPTKVTFIDINANENSMSPAIIRPISVELAALNDASWDQVWSKYWLIERGFNDWGSEFARVTKRHLLRWLNNVS